MKQLALPLLLLGLLSAVICTPFVLFKDIGYSKTVIDSTTCVQIDYYREAWDDAPTTYMLLEEGVMAVKACAFYSFRSEDECVVTSGIDKYSLKAGTYKQVACPVSKVTVLERNK